MFELIESIQTTITVKGAEIPINVGAEQAVKTQEAFRLAKDGEMSDLTAISIAYDLMLNREFDVFNIDKQEVKDVLDELTEYFIKYARISEIDKESNKPPLINWSTDIVLIRDALSLIPPYNINPFEIGKMSYPELMQKIRLIATVEAPYNRLLYIRSLYRDKKLDKKEYKNEKKEAESVWGMDMVRMVDVRKLKAEKQHEDEFLAEKNRIRAEQGLPPL